MMKPPPTDPNARLLIAALNLLAALVRLFDRHGWPW
jgi:hypothetical protein